MLWPPMLRHRKARIKNRKRKRRVLEPWRIVQRVGHDLGRFEMHGHSECVNPYPLHDFLLILKAKFEDSVDKHPTDPHEKTTNHNLSPHPHKNMWL